MSESSQGWRGSRAVAALRRGSAWRGAPSRIRAWSAALALALLGTLAPARAATPPAPAPAPLRFEGIAWDLPRAEFLQALAQHGWPGRKGTLFGRHAWVTEDYDARGRVIAIDVYFAWSARGSALQRYADIVAAMRARHGEPMAEIAPGHPVTEERLGHFGRLRRFGPLTAATLWTDAAGGGAIVQLEAVTEPNGHDFVVMRYESPDWAAEQAREDSAAGARAHKAALSR